MTFTQLIVIYDIINICEKYNDLKIKKKLLKLIENISYLAPEIRENLFWNGNEKWCGIVKILNNNLNNNSNIGKEINKYYKNMIYKYKENHGFDLY
tara:strand:+ start:636 stop:923 length:288 start_codon:yes stop_codon:yes gene_type:complete